MDFMDFPGNQIFRKKIPTTGIRGLSNFQKEFFSIFHLFFFSYSVASVHVLHRRTGKCGWWWWHCWGCGATIALFLPFWRCAHGHGGGHHSGRRKLEGLVGRKLLGPKNSLEKLQNLGNLEFCTKWKNA